MRVYIESHGFLHTENASLCTKVVTKVTQAAFAICEIQHHTTFCFHDAYLLAAACAPHFGNP